MAGLSDGRLMPGGFIGVPYAVGGCAPGGQQPASINNPRKGSRNMGTRAVSCLRAANENLLQLRVKVTIDVLCSCSCRNIDALCSCCSRSGVRPPESLVCAPGTRQGSPGQCLWRRNGNCPTVHPCTGMARSMLSIHTPSHLAQWLDPSPYLCRKLEGVTYVHVMFGYI